VAETQEREEGPALQVPKAQGQRDSGSQQKQGEEPPSDPSQPRLQQAVATWTSSTHLGVHSDLTSLLSVMVH
jgi:hypothetical protein